MTRSTRFTTVFCVATLAGSVACGDDAADPSADTAATTSDAGVDAPDAGVPVIHGCETFTDLTAAGAERVVRFGGDVGTAFSPGCVRVAAGQTVTFQGPFGGHPLTPGRAPSHAGDPEGSPDTPIAATGDGEEAAFAFSAAGVYPFHCGVHFSLGMIGVVLVE